MTSIRLLPYGEYSGAYNMALDRLLLERVSAGLSAPTFRLYGWNRPTLSLGRSQDESLLEDLDRAATDFEVVQRPTGGAVAVHGRDLSYCLVAPFPGPILPDRPKAFYEAIHQSLARALGGMDFPVECVPEKRGNYREKIYCGLTLNACDIISEGKKVVGSAQRISAQAILQHGFILLDEDFAWVREQLGEVGDSIASACRALSDIRPVHKFELGVPLRKAILDELCRSTGLDFRQGDLDCEEERVLNLV
jgi:lipoyl(octanoyl) transferase